MIKLGSSYFYLFYISFDFWRPWSKPKESIIDEEGNIHFVPQERNLKIKLKSGGELHPVEQADNRFYWSPCFG